MGNVIQAKTFQLQAPIGSTDTTIAVKNLETIYGDDVVMAGSIQYSTLEPESQSNQEIISFTGITAVSTNVWNLTGVTRGLDAQPTAGVYGNNPAQGKAHASSVDCILSDSPQVWDDKASKSEDEVITGNWQFTGHPTTTTPVSGSDIATKDYADGIATAGAPDASTTTKGNTRLSYSSTVTIGTATMTIASPCVVSFTAHGLTLNDSIQFTTTGALPTGLSASTNYYVISAGLTANSFRISLTLGGAAINTTGSQSGTHTLYKTTPVAFSTQDPSLTGLTYLGTPGSGNKFMTQAGVQSGGATYGVDLGGDDTYVVALTPALTAYTTGQTLYAKMTTANTGACTIDFGPGVKSVKLQDGTDPLDGNIGALQTHIFIYDGTNLVLQNPVSVVNSANTIGKMFTLNENMTAGDVAYVDSDGEINTWDGYRSAASSLGATVTPFGSCLVDTNTIVVIYYRSSSVYAKAGTISGETITWGTETAVLWSGSNAGVCKADTNAGCFIGYSGTAIQGRPFTVSGTTITLGSAVTLNSASTNVTGAVCICQIDTNKVAFAYNAVTSTPQACIGTISGNVLSNGAEYNISSANSLDRLTIVKMATTKLGVVGKTSGGTTMYANAATISGTILTFGSVINFNSGSGTNSLVYGIAITTDLFAVFYSTTAPNLYARYLSVSGTTVTASSESTILAGGQMNNNYQGEALLFNNNTISVTSGSDSISFVQLNNVDLVFNLLNTVPMASLGLLYGRVLYSTGNMVVMNTTNSYFFNNNGRYIVGILQTTGTAGQSKKVTTTGGVSSVHSSLQIGEPYYSQVEGGVGLQALLYANNVNYSGIAKIGTAISATEILVNIV